MCCALGLSVWLMAARPPKTNTPTSKATTQTSPTSKPTTRNIPTSRPTTHKVQAKKGPFKTSLPKDILLPNKQIGPAQANVILFSGGLKSYYEPCGCQADMLGGLPRLGALVGGLRYKGIKPLRLDAGNLYFEKLKLAKSKQTQAHIKADMVADMFGMIGYRVVGVGPYDLTFGLSTLKRLAKRNTAHTIASNIVDVAGKAIFPTHVVFDWKGEKVGVFSLTDAPSTPNKEDPWPKDFWSARKLKRLAPLKTAQRMVALLQKKGAKKIILLSTLGFQKVEAILEKVKGIHVAIEGAEDAELTTPKRIESAFLVSTPKEGQKAGLLSFYVQKAGLPWARVETAGQRKAAIKKMDEQVASYMRQAAQMKKQGAAFAPLAGIYINQANALRKKIVAAKKLLSAPAQLKKGHNGYLHFLVPLARKLGEDPTIAERLARYGEDVKKANLKALAAIKPILKNAKGNFYAGVNKCKTCHVAAYQFWKKTRHANAYPTLVKDKKQYDLDCIGCHVTGWLKPGGLYNIKKPHRLASVQCENCHSYGGLHAASANKALIVRNVPESTCKGCHHPPHDKSFNFHDRLKKILGKGHGEARLKLLLQKK